MPIPENVSVPYPPDADYNKQMYEVPGTKKPGQTAHYRNSAFPLLTLDTPDAFINLVEYFESGRQRTPGSAPMLGQRPVISRDPLKLADHYVWLSWDQVDVRRRHIGSALYKLFADGVVSSPLKGVGIYSANCPAWQLVELACNAYELVSVSLYDTLGKDTVEYIINHTDLTILFTSAQHLTKILKMAGEKKIPTLKYLIAMEPLTEESKGILRAWGDQVGLKVMDIVEVEETGKSCLREPIIPASDYPATICYTSGTTGHPKGAVLTHGNIANSVHAQLLGFDFAEKALSISFLPLAHCYGRMAELSIIARGGTIGYWSGDPLLLLEDMQILKPNTFPAVPRVLNRIYQAGMAAAALPGIKGALFRHALEVKLARLHATGSFTHPIWDRLVFKKIQAVLGGNLMVVTTGSAPMSAAALNFLKVACACEVFEENVGTATKTWKSDKKSAGYIGAISANMELKLLDVPDLGYTSDDKPYPRGEILLRGDGCFKSYYKDEKNTRAVIDVDGWQHSGDVGEIGEGMRIRIIDRVKNLLKLSQGEYVALERIESLYNACPIVYQLYVHGDSLQSYLIALVIPDPVQLAAIASKIWSMPVSDKDREALDRAVRDPKVNEAVLQALTVQGKAAELQGFEMIKRVYMTNDLLTVDNECLTPTLKIKRKEVYAKYKNELDGLYALGEPAKNVVKL